ncbi:hypothetical protein EVJ58_g1468 [Rhodofomes roseus]|uniref:NAD-dependent epimerase/dehydratase domain-containing protein n=1 Tax=Rhodofomes roseus TaxID=34475 RepID=A0A4Y9Z1G8_9APHY|nr:hypothetical protein EVJ58_g1468 [Rhodofomes roseus]
MPAITSGKILVTGANGYIALWLVRKLLDQGYAVRGTVRSEGKARHLRETFRSHNRLETIVIEDITKEGAFDEAVNGVDAIAHLASPVVLGVDNPEELIAPAVRGTMRVFESALAYGTSVQRIVLTSSCAAIREFRDLPRTFTEEDWNDASLAEVRARGPAASITDKYCASKVLAERAAWEFVEKNRREGKIGWDLVVICPSMCWVDVRDVAEAHVLAFQKKEAGEERIIASEGPWRWQDFGESTFRTPAICDELMEMYVSEVKAAHEADACLPPGDATYDPTVAGHSFLFDAAKSMNILELKYHTKQESTDAMIRGFKAHGLL